MPCLVPIPTIPLVFTLLHFLKIPPNCSIMPFYSSQLYIVSLYSSQIYYSTFSLFFSLRFNFINFLYFHLIEWHLNRIDFVYRSYWNKNSTFSPREKGSRFDRLYGILEEVKTFSRSKYYFIHN